MQMLEYLKCFCLDYSIIWLNKTENWLNIYGVAEKSGYISKEKTIA